METARPRSWTLILISLNAINCMMDSRGMNGMNGMSGMSGMHYSYGQMFKGGMNSCPVGKKASNPTGKPESYMNGSTYGMTNSNMNGGYGNDDMSPSPINILGNGMMKMYGMEMMDPAMLKFLQPNDLGRDRKYDDLSHNDGYLCARDCCKYSEPRLCYYQFTCEQYSAMGPACGNCTFGNNRDCMQSECITCDGIERTVYAINRRIPGPMIRVCKGDRIVVDVSNIMLSESITIHWHGILMKDAPWNDGVPFLTQCPIPAMSGLFRYDFTVDEAGTYFYHSHSGKCQSNGIFGPLIIDECEDPHRCLYDYDLSSHVLTINDWDHLLSDSFYPGYWQNDSYIMTQPNSYLFNGRGNYKDSVTKTTTPKYEVHVRSGGYRYRLRIIAATTAVCLFKVAIEGHTMKLIATDGYPCEPKTFKTLVMGAGIRYDVVITSKKEHTSTCSYNIVVSGMQGCFNVTYTQTAYLVYDDCDPVPTSRSDLVKIYNTGPYLENVDLGCKSDDVTCSYELESTDPAQERLLCGKPVDQRFFLHMGFHTYTYDEAFRSETVPYPDIEVPIGPVGFYTDTINNCSSLMPWFPLLYQDDPIDRSMICPGGCRNNESFCTCINMIHCEKDSVIEFVMLDEMGAAGNPEVHPMHIHGHNWRVCYQGSMKERMADKDTFYLKTTKTKCPLKRDMCLIPNGGWATVRFIADNPGYWMFHCHFENHLISGMFLTIEVGERSQMKRPPPDFPRCSAYLPKITNMDDYKPSTCHCSNPSCDRKSCSCKSKVRNKKH